MAVEPKRLCGFRRINGLYLCGDYIPVECDRLPYPLETCRVCGGGIKISRGFTKIDPLELFGYHVPPCACRTRSLSSKVPFGPCMMCDPEHDPAFIMRVGEGHYKTPGDFVQEAMEMGVSKRIPFLPKEMEFGKTVVYLAHPKACRVKHSVALQQAMALVHAGSESTNRLLDTEQVEYKTGIFSAFRPQRVEKLIWEKDATPEELESLEKRGITPVVIKNGDPDHG